MTSKILIAEDNKQIAEVYQKLLEKKGNDVTVTYDGQECIDAYKSEMKSGKNISTNPYDVVLVDFAMPKKDGLALVSEILNKRSSQKIIFATAYVDQVKKQIHKIGKTVIVLNKPFTSKSLYEVIETKFTELGNKKTRSDGSTEWEKISGSDENYWTD